jgi:opacity protein-like surface antigen
MNKLLIFCFVTLLIFFSIFQVNAQSDSIKIIIGGNTSFDFSNIKLFKETETGNKNAGETLDLEFDGLIGFFANKKLMFGIDIPLSYVKETDENEKADYSSITSTLSLMPFIRRYIGNGKLKPYLHGGIGIGWGRNKYFESYDEIKVSLQILAYEIGGGISYFLNDHLAIDFNVLYGGASIKWINPYTDNDEKRTGSGVGSSIGLIICL